MEKRLIEVMDGFPEWYVVNDRGEITAGPFDEEIEADLAVGWHWHGSLAATFPGDYS